MLSRPCACPLEISGVIHELFDACYCSKEVYRATGVVLLDLEADADTQYTLFDDPIQAEKIKDIYGVADELGQKFGKHAVHLGSSHLIDVLGKGRRGMPTVREQTKMLGETNRRHLGLPLLHVKV